MSDGTDCSEENTPLLGNSISQQPSCYSKVKSKFKSRRWSSKAALIILMWNMIVSFGLTAFLDPSLYIISIVKPDQYCPDGDECSYMNLITELVMGVTYGASALILLFYPLAGCLADIRWGRHKTVVNSLYFIFGALSHLLYLVACCLSV